MTNWVCILLSYQVTEKEVKVHTKIKLPTLECALLIVITSRNVTDNISSALEHYFYTNLNKEQFFLLQTIAQHNTSLTFK